MIRNRGWGIAAKGDEKPKDRDFIGVFVYIVSPGYLSAMGMRLLEGRDIGWHDVIENRKVAVINNTVAEASGPDGIPSAVQLW